MARDRVLMALFILSFVLMLVGLAGSIIAAVS